MIKYSVDGQEFETKEEAEINFLTKMDMLATVFGKQPTGKIEEVEYVLVKKIEYEKLKKDNHDLEKYRKYYESVRDISLDSGI